MTKTKKGLAYILSALLLATTISVSNGLVVKAAGSSGSNDKAINGDWSATYVQLYDTEETELMVRVGDIDNFGYGWSENFNPFTGAETEVHPYPFNPSKNDPDGTDRIMVVSGYNKNSGAATDGYTSDTPYGYNNKLVPVTLNYDLKGKKVDNAVIQIFIDDIQPSKWIKVNDSWINRGRGGFSENSLNQYQVTFCVKGQKPVRIPEFEEIINNLDQHGPIGKLVTFAVPDRYLSMLEEGEDGFQIKIDDPNTKATVKDTWRPNTGDGYAIDFVKLMINKKSEYDKNNGTIKGRVYEAYYQGTKLIIDKNKPISGAEISISGLKDVVYSDSKGNYSSNKVPAGMVVLNAQKDGYAEASYTIGTLEAGQTVQYDIGLVKTDKPITPTITLNTYRRTNQDVTVTIKYLGTVTKELYRINGGQWKNYTGPFTVGQNCLIEAKSIKSIKVNKTQTKDFESDICSLEVTNIDKSTPPAPILTPDTTDFVNRDVKVTVKYPADQVITEVKVKLGTDDWKTYSDTEIPKELNIDKNMDISVKYQNDAGNWSEPGNLKITNIDKENPTGRVIVTYSGNTATLDLKIDEDEVVEIIPTVGEYTHNGITYKIQANKILKADNDDEVGIIKPGGRQVVFYANGKYTFKFKDLAGNIGMATGIAELGSNNPLDPSGRQER